MKKILALVVLLSLLGMSVCFADTAVTPVAKSESAIVKAASETTSVAEDVINTLNPQVGMMYAIREQQVKEVTSLQVLNYQSQKYAFVKGNLNVLYAPSDMVGLSVTYPVGSLSQITGINIPVPVLDWVTKVNLNLGWGIGYLTGGDSRHTDNGPIVSGNIKF